MKGDPMNRKDYRKKMEFIKGYRMGYKYHATDAVKITGKSEDFKRGYIEARMDFKAEEPPLF